jgi:hypothetical protein
MSITLVVILCLGCFWVGGALGFIFAAMVRSNEEPHHGR